MSAAALLLAAVVSYDVQAGEGARVLEVTAELPPGVARLVFEDGFGAYAGDREARRGDAWTPLPSAGDDVPLPAGARALRYRFRLADLARETRRRSTAYAAGEALLSPPSTWLARPSRLAGRFRLKVHTPPGLAFATGLFPGPEADTYEADLAHLAVAPYSAFGPFEVRAQAVGGGTVAAAVLPGPLAVTEEALLRWVREAALDVAGYYGRLPVPRVLVLVVPGGRRAVGYGTTMGHGGASIMVSVGPRAREEDLAKDWVLTHEMVHLALPNLPRRHFWLEEGIATYVEPIARARRGRLAASDFWTGLVDGLPKGLPQAGDGGLDGTRSWGRTYWGGALFCFLAEMTLREATGAGTGLEDALRGVQAAGGSIALDWDLARLLETADAATGTTVLRDLHARMGPRALPVDLSHGGSRLGVGPARGQLRDDAPLAAVRRALLRPPGEDSRAR